MLVNRPAHCWRPLGARRLDGGLIAFPKGAGSNPEQGRRLYRYYSTVPVLFKILVMFKVHAQATLRTLTFYNLYFCLVILFGYFLVLIIQLGTLYITYNILHVTYI